MDPNNLNEQMEVDSNDANSSNLETIPDNDERTLAIMNADVADDEGNFSDLEDTTNFGNPLFVNFLDPLHCQNEGCGKLLKVPIRQCPTNHLFCSNCHEGQVYCMLCTPGNLLSAAPSVDAILDTIMDVCPYKFLGCNDEFSFHQVQDHLEEQCQYACLMCPIPQCFDYFFSRRALGKHLTRNHGTHVQTFQSGVPAPFVFEMHNDTRVLLESETNHPIFVVHYNVGPSATLLKFFGVSHFEDPPSKYRIMDEICGAALLAESAVPITTLKEGVGAIGFGGSLSHQLRSGEFNHLHCTFVITIND